MRRIMGTAFSGVLVLGLLAATGPAASGVGPSPTRPPTGSPAAAAERTAGTPPSSDPRTPEGYAWATVQAWRSGRLHRLGQLTDPVAYRRLRALAADAGQRWQLGRCEGAAGHSWCTFTAHRSRDRLVLALLNVRLAQPHAVDTVRFTAGRC